MIFHIFFNPVSTYFQSSLVELVNYTCFWIDVWDNGLMVPVARLSSSALMIVWTERGQKGRRSSYGAAHLLEQCGRLRNIHLFLWFHHLCTTLFVLISPFSGLFIWFGWNISFEHVQIQSITLECQRCKLRDMSKAVHMNPEARFCKWKEACNKIKMYFF